MRQFQFGLLKSLMLYPIVKALLSGVIILAISEIAKRNAALGALFASLPLLSILAVIWMWEETLDTERIAAHVYATFWYVLPSLPMFLLLPVLLRHGIGFWIALAGSSGITFVLYLATIAVAGRFGVRL